MVSCRLVLILAGRALPTSVISLTSKTSLPDGMSTYQTTCHLVGQPSCSERPGASSCTPGSTMSSWSSPACSASKRWRWPSTSFIPKPKRPPGFKYSLAAEQEGVLPSDFADLAGIAVELRNWLSHPATAIALTPGMAAPALENTHRLVGLVLTAATTRRTAST